MSRHGLDRFCQRNVRFGFFDFDGFRFVFASYFFDRFFNSFFDCFFNRFTKGFLDGFFYCLVRNLFWLFKNRFFYYFFGNLRSRLGR